VFVGKHVKHNTFISSTLSLISNKGTKNFFLGMVDVRFDPCNGTLFTDDMR